MKPKSRFLRPILAAALFGSTASITWAYTVEIDPATPIPATHTQTFATEWDTAGNPEGWTANNFTLEAGAPIGGILTGTETNNDPTLTLGGKSIKSSPDSIVEFRIKKATADASRIDLFWADDNGGIGHVAPVRIDSPPGIHDDQFHVVRITFGGSDLNGKFKGFRLDPSADHSKDFVTTSLDYFRVYSVLSTTVDLNWDPGKTASPAGGSGPWNTTDAFWWNGAADVKWPATSSGTDNAVLGGTAGTVTIQAAGITAASLETTVGGYTLAGGPLTLDGAANIRATDTLLLDAPIAGSADVSVVSGVPIFRVSSTLNGTLKLNNEHTVTTVDDPFGSAKVTLGAGGNVFLSAVNQERSFSNDFELRYNRLIIDSATYGQGIGAFGVIIDGDVNLALTAPGDIFLRRNLTINGKITGAGAPGKSLFFAGDANTMTLGAVNNTFTGDIVFSLGTRLVYQDDSSLGDPANNLVFNGGQGALEPQNDFTSARSITINGDTAAIIDTDYETTWEGTITGQNGVNSRMYKEGAGTLTLTGTATFGGGTQVRDGIMVIPAGGSLTHGNTWDNNHGIAGLATMRLDGGDFTINSSFYGIGNGINPEDEATFEILDGTYTHIGGALLLGFRGNGHLVMNGGEVTLNELNYGDGGPDSVRTAIADLNGGTLAFNAASRRGGEAAATIRFNGTTIKALRDEADFLRAGTEGTTDFLVSDGSARFDSNGHDVGIQSPLQHDPDAASTDGGLVKSGAGALFLVGDHSYNGPTSVNEGTFGGNGTITSSVTIGGGLPALVGVDAGLAVMVNQTGGVAGTDHSLLEIDGSLTVSDPLTIRILSGPDPFVENDATGMTVITASGGINGFNAGSVIFDTSTFTGTGSFTASQSGNSIVLSYAAGAPGGYANFATTITDTNLRGELDDADQDGVSNLLEYVLGGDPNAADPGILPRQTLDASNLTLTFDVTAASAADTAVKVQLSTDLADWTSIPSLPVTGTGPQTIQIPRNSRAKLFARVVASND